MSTPGRQLRKARLKAGMRQLDLARTLGVSQSAVSLWESGRYAPSPMLRTSILKALGTDPYR